MNLSSYIDHTVLKAETTSEHIQKLCAEAIEHHFKAVCVPPYFVKEAAALLQHSNVLLCTVVGFPLGYALTESKVLETKLAMEQGAYEIDMVVNIAAVKSKNWEYVENDIASIYTTVKEKKCVLKVIFETAALTNDEIISLCEICNKIGVDFLKTSTGFHAAGRATITHVSLLRKHALPSIQIKASGGIKTKNDALEFIKAGADRLGTSSGVQIVKE